MKGSRFAPALFAIATSIAAAPLEVKLTWSELSPLPDAHGFAAPFAGTVGGRLVVAGGANFPDGRPWDGATKVWHSTIFLLDAHDAAWRRAGKLPRPLGYGVSITLPAGVLCIGGGDQRENVRDTFLLSIADGSVTTRPMPPLPIPLANACGALVGEKVYVAGGQESPTGGTTSHVLVLDVSQPADQQRWEELRPWPGRPRILAMAGASENAFFLFGGTDLVPSGKGSFEREYLSDAWRYDPASGWKRLAELPSPRAAAPSPLPYVDSKFLLLGGDDGELATQVGALKDHHPGFSATILAYDLGSDAWSIAGEMPREPGSDFARRPDRSVMPPVTTGVVEWLSSYVIPTGEIRPGVRTPRVFAAATSTSEQ